VLAAPRWDSRPETTSLLACAAAVRSPPWLVETGTGWNGCAPTFKPDPDRSRRDCASHFAGTPCYPIPYRSPASSSTRQARDVLIAYSSWLVEPDP
jgi:hypothetical protein